MDKYTEYLNNKVMDQAFDIGKLRGTLKVIMKYNSSSLPEHVVKDIERVLEQTDSKPEEQYRIQ